MLKVRKFEKRLNLRKNQDNDKVEVKVFHVNTTVNPSENSRKANSEINPETEDCIQLDRRHLNGAGSYSFKSKNALLRFYDEVYSDDYIIISWTVRYNGKYLPKAFIENVTERLGYKSLKPFGAGQLLKVLISKVFRHVMHKEFILSLRYSFVNDPKKQIYASLFKFKIPYFETTTKLSFANLEQHRPSSKICKLFNNDFKIEEFAFDQRMQETLKQIDNYCRTPLEQRTYNVQLPMLSFAQTVEDLEGMKSLKGFDMCDVKLSVTIVEIEKEVLIDEKKVKCKEKVKFWSFEMTHEKIMELKNIEFTEIYLQLIPMDKYEAFSEEKLRNEEDFSDEEDKEKLLKQNTLKETEDDIYKKIYDFKYDKILIDPDNRISSKSLYFISFQPNRIAARASLTALRSIEKKMLTAYLGDFKDPPEENQEIRKKFTEKQFIDEDFVWYNSHVAANIEQQVAIKNIVNCTAFPFPYVIFGPPGTGKTTCLVECIAQIIKLRPECNVLVSAQSNSASDEIGIRLLDIIKPQLLLRIYSASMEKGRANQVILSSSNFCNEKNSTLPSYEELHSFKIVIVTLLGTSKLVQSDIRKAHFDYIFVDECAAASEPESLVPIIGIGAETNEITANIVLSGDHKQLGAVINSRYAENMGLGISLMERIMTKERYKPNPDYDHLYVTQLLDNYRCHPAILKFSNAQFYDNLLRSKIDYKNSAFAEKWNFLPTKDFPILFHCIKQPSKVEEYGTSSFNNSEIRMIKFYVDNLLMRGINGKKVYEQDIGIVSPYLAQLKRLREKVPPNIEIGTAEYYQGREKKIIIISTVKSGTGMGFLRNEKRLNVILTRAQSLLIIVGNPETLQQDRLWKSFIHFCHINHVFVGEPFNLRSMADEDEQKVGEMSTQLKNLKAEDNHKETYGPINRINKNALKDRLKKLQEIMKQLEI